MRAVVQRVKSADVTVENISIGSIGPGLLVYLGIAAGDTEADSTYLAEKVVNLRIMPDHAGRMNLSVLDISAEILVVSQFTLMADVRKGRRPSYNMAETPEKAQRYYNLFIDNLLRYNLTVATGKFQAMMDVSYINEGPVTILIDSRKDF